MDDYTVKELSDMIKHFCEARDWDQFHNPKDLAIGISTEANELLDIFRFKSKEDFNATLFSSAETTNNQSTSSSQGLGEIIIDGLGGRENIVSIDNCFTRLRLVLKDVSLADEQKLKSTGAVGLSKINETNLQVIYGPQVESIALKVKEAGHFSED